MASKFEIDKNKFVDINEITDFVIGYFNNLDVDITPLKLQKILYYIQAWHLVFFKKHPLFNEEPEAWVNGPVYRTIYNRFKDNWYSGETLTIGEPENIESDFEDIKNNVKLTKTQKELLFTVLQKYGKLSAGELVYITHVEDPWNKAREGLEPFERCDNHISFDNMYNYYEEKRKKSN